MGDQCHVAYIFRGPNWRFTFFFKLKKSAVRKQTIIRYLLLVKLIKRQEKEKSAYL